MPQAPDDAEYRATLREVDRLSRSGAHADASTLLDDLINRIEIASGAHSDALVQPLSDLFTVLMRANDWKVISPEARTAADRGIELALASRGNLGARAAAGIRRMLAIALAGCGAQAEAVKHMRLVVRQTELDHGRGPVLANDLRELGWMLLDAEISAEALIVFDQACAMVSGLGDSKLDAMLLYGRGRALLALGNAAEAVSALEAASQVWRDRFGDGGAWLSEFLDWTDRARSAASA